MGGEEPVPPDYITIPKSEFQALRNEVKRGGEICVEVANLKFLLQSIAGRLGTRLDKTALIELQQGVAACEEVARMRVEIEALGRRLAEFDQELTPVRPPSRADIKAAFDNANEFASGKKKPGPQGPQGSWG